MQTYRYHYVTPEGFSDLWMESDGEFLTGLWFEKYKDQYKHDINGEVKLTAIFEETAAWLDIYFQGKDPGWLPKYKINHLTPFREEVIDLLRIISFGEIVTYGDLAKELAKLHGIKKMSAQAVGGAVGWNPLCILIPCHRVIGANRSLTGYGGGIKNKIALLGLEGHDVSKFTIPLQGDMPPSVYTG